MTPPPKNLLVSNAAHYCGHLWLDNNMPKLQTLSKSKTYFTP